MTDNENKMLFTLIERNDGKVSEDTLTALADMTGLIVAKGGKVELRGYTEAEYSTIRAEADGYAISGYRRYNYFDYERGGKEHFVTQPLDGVDITDGQILVMDGAFYGALLPYRYAIDGRTQREYYVVAERDGAEVVTIAEHSYSEWGNTMDYQRKNVKKRS